VPGPLRPGTGAEADGLGPGLARSGGRGQGQRQTARGRGRPGPWKPGGRGRWPGFRAGQGRGGRGSEVDGLGPVPARSVEAGRVGQGQDKRARTRSCSWMQAGPRPGVWLQDWLGRLRPEERLEPEGRGPGLSGPWVPAGGSKVMTRGPGFGAGHARGCRHEATKPGPGRLNPGRSGPRRTATRLGDMVTEPAGFGSGIRTM
jgi:hypothetical protein